MEEKNNCVKVGFSRILWTVTAILLCAAPCLWAMDITEPTDGPVYAEGEVNVYADITYGLFAAPGSTVNIYAGAIGDGMNYGITVSTDQPPAGVTVHGKAFALNDEVLDPIPDQVTFTDDTGTLTVTYDNDTIADLLFWSNIPINLVNTAAGEPLEAQLWVFPSLINRYGPLSKIWAMVRLPEGITKDDIDSEPLVLNPGGIEATCQYAFQWYEEGIVRTSIIASFDKASLMEAVPDDGEVELEVVGGLTTGQDFSGIDNVRIVSWSW